MTWSKFDDGYDEHEKIEDAWFAYPPNPVGLHVMATTACNRWLSDGVVRPRWLAHKLSRISAKARSSFLADMVGLGLFDALPAGGTATFTDAAGNTIIVGPFEEDRFIVHDFLERHDSSIQVKIRRGKDAARKRGRNGDGIHADSTWNPDGVQTESAASRVGAREGAPARPDPTRPDHRPPLPPKGKRSRDIAAYENDLAIFAAMLFPDADPDQARGHVDDAIRRLGPECTADQVRDIAARWLEPTLSDEQRDRLAEVGGQVLAFNASAEGAA